MPVSTGHAPDRETQGTSLQAHGAEQWGDKGPPRGVTRFAGTVRTLCLHPRPGTEPQVRLQRPGCPRELQDSGTHRPPAVRGSAPPPKPSIATRLSGSVKGRLGFVPWSLGQVSTLPKARKPLLRFSSRELDGLWTTLAPRPCLRPVRNVRVLRDEAGPQGSPGRWCV